MTTLTAVQTYQQPGVAMDAEHRYTFHGAPVPGVTELLRRYYLSADWLQVPAQTLLLKRELGTAVHRATHYEDEGTLDVNTVDPALEPYLAAWRAFKADSGFEALLLETPLVHPLYRYAGTPDRFGWIRWGRQVERLAIVDLKTGDPEDAGAAYQTAAYANALRSVLAGDLLTAARPFASALGLHSDHLEEPWERISVQLKPDGRYKLGGQGAYLDVRDWHRFKEVVGLNALRHPSWKENV